jgi:hypothetical protein
VIVEGAADISALARTAIVRAADRHLQEAQVACNSSDWQLNEALRAFTSEALLYCDGISDTAGKEYALEYSQMIQTRAKGIKVALPRIPSGLFGPNSYLIRSMWKA